MFFEKSQKPEQKKEKFVIPQYPSYAVAVEKYLAIDVDKHFSGEKDDDLFLVELFDNAKDAIQYLRDHPSAKGGYLFCLDQDLQTMEEFKKAQKDFGVHIVKAIHYHDYVRSNWERNPLPPDQVRVFINPHNPANKPSTPKSECTIM